MYDLRDQISPLIPPGSTDHAENVKSSADE